MNRDDIIRMANEAGIIHPEMVYQTLERFAALVASAEREACAKLCDENWRYTANASEMAEYIRARVQA